MVQIIPAFGQLSAASRVRASAHAPYGAVSFFFAITISDPTHRRKVQLESATRLEIIGEHSHEDVIHRSR